MKKYNEEKKVMQNEVKELLKKDILIAGKVVKKDGYNLVQEMRYRR